MSLRRNTERRTNLCLLLCFQIAENKIQHLCKLQNGRLSRCATQSLNYYHANHGILSGSVWSSKTNKMSSEGNFFVNSTQTASKLSRRKILDFRLSFPSFKSLLRKYLFLQTVHFNIFHAYLPIEHVNVNFVGDISFRIFSKIIVSSVSTQMEIGFLLPPLLLQE